MAQSIDQLEEILETNLQQDGDGNADSNITIPLPSIPVSIAGIKFP